MTQLNTQSLGGAAISVLGMLVFGCLFRLGWEIGARIWGAF